MAEENNGQVKPASKKTIDPAKVKSNPNITTMIKQSKDSKERR
jgi:hypothetical protein